MCLFLWKEIFADDVPFVFQTPYQTAPLDLYLDDIFYNSRRTRIDKRLAEIAEMSKKEREDTIREIYLAKKGLKNPFIDWDSHKLTMQNLAAIGGLMQGKVLQIVFKRLLSNLKTWSHGWPDLVCWGNGKVKFVEVKSQTDKLSEN